MITGAALRYLLGILFSLIVTATIGAAEPLPVFVGIEPLVSIVTQIGGEHVTVEALLAGGGDPHTFSPTPKQITRLGRGKVFFSVGLPFEVRLCEKLADHGSLKVVHTDAGIEKRSGGCSHGSHEGHQHHGPACQHETQGNDPHIWLSIPLIRLQAQNIVAGLCAVDPANCEDYKQNLRTFLTNAEVVHRRIADLLAPHQGKSFYVFHPSFTYFGSDYGLTEVAVEVEGKLPAPKQLAQLTGEMKSAGVKTIFVQPQFDQRSAATIADAIGCDIVVLDPLARDLLPNLEETARALAASLARP
jgi:zinc transport system substrate-binding protein